MSAHYSIIEKHAAGVAYDGEGPRIDYLCEAAEYLSEVPTTEGRPGSKVYVKTALGITTYVLGVDRTWSLESKVASTDFGYYDELPVSGIEGNTYITPNGVFHYKNGAYSPIGNNGFMMSRGSNDEVIVSYTDPSNGDLATPVTMPKNSTLTSIVTKCTDIANNLSVIAGNN